MKIGSARYGGGKKNFKIKDGDNIYGILPPMGELADKGKWSQYYRIEWGYKDSTGKNKPFQDVRVTNRKTKMVEIESAAHLLRESYEAHKKNVAELFKAGQATRDDVKEAAELCKRYNLECKHYMNVITPQGEIGLLKLGHRAKLALDGAIKSLRDQGIDPIGLEGMYFNINRFVPPGKALDTTYTVTPYQENVSVLLNGKQQIVQQRKAYVLDEIILSRLDQEAYELNKLYPVITAEQVEEIVNQPTEADVCLAVDRILGKSDAPVIDDAPEEEETPAVTKPIITKPVYQKPTTLAKPTVTPTVTTTKPVVTKPTVTKPVTTTKPAVVSAPIVVEEDLETNPEETTEENSAVAQETMSNDDFLRSIGITL
ncbi:MAG TPA: hypothetical protein VI911_11580 [Patescibacteria group bacterium]|nr:hypothetical protein [Patescibacteria group bacterium]